MDQPNFPQRPQPQQGVPGMPTTMPTNMGNLPMSGLMQGARPL